MKIPAIAACIGLCMAATAAQEKRAGVIVGRVIDAGTGAPLPGVVVRAIRSGDPASMPATGLDDRLTLLTDAQGRFLFSNLPKATYTISATMGGTGYSPAGFRVSGFGQRIAPYLEGGYGQRRPDGPLQPIVLGDDERVTDAVIRLWRGGSISGQVFDEAGEPLVDVVVAAVRRSSDGRLLNGPTTRTDDHGRYRLGTLAPGSYVVVVPQMQILLPPSPPTSPAVRVTNALPPAATGAHVYQTTFHPSAPAAGRATPIAIGSGEERQGINVLLTPVSAAPVSGTLIDASGPVANFGVSLLPQESGDGMSILEVATTNTDATGAFVFPLVPQGRYRLFALRTPGSLPPGAKVPPPSQVLADTPGAWASQDIAVNEQGTKDIVLTLRPGVRVSGRVEFDGTAERPAPDRLRQLELILTRVEPITRNVAATVAAPVGPSAEFVAIGAFPGPYLVTVRDAPPWRLQSIASAGREIAEQVVSLESDVKDVVITMTDRAAEIAGTIRPAPDGSAEDVSIFLFPADQERWIASRSSPRAFRTVRVLKDGTFAFPGLVAGEYLVAAVRDDAATAWPDRGFLARLAAHATTVRLTHGETQRVNLNAVSVR